MQIKWISLTF